MASDPYEPDTTKDDAATDAGDVDKDYLARDDRDEYERMSTWSSESSHQEVPISRAGEANDTTNGFRPSNEPEGCCRDGYGDYPDKFSGGPRPGRSAYTVLDNDPQAESIQERPSQGMVADEEFVNGVRYDGGRSDA